MAEALISILAFFPRYQIHRYGDIVEGRNCLRHDKLAGLNYDPQKTYTHCLVMQMR